MFLDLSAAFDTEDYSIPVFNWEKRFSLCGVPQVSVLGPSSIMRKRGPSLPFYADDSQN